MKLDVEKYLAVAKHSATEASKYLANNFGQSHKLNFKSKYDVGITEDKESEAIILNIIKGKHPSHNYYSEEFGEYENGSEFTWFIDPLDGTNNYVAGIPYFSISISISIALLFNKEIIVGVVYNPISNQFFEAVKNGGAFLNGCRITPSKNYDYKKSIVSFVQGHQIANTTKLKNDALKIKSKLEENFRRVITTWAPALDWVLLGSGGIDALVSFESEPEDMYAGLLIAKESGAEISNFMGHKFTINTKIFVAANKSIHRKVIELLL